MDQFNIGYKIDCKTGMDHNNQTGMDHLIKIDVGYWIYGMDCKTGMDHS